ncbi:DUF485 domain-containing protein [Cytobacillus firmus]|uniref:DUF485 domain-containing protein n=1 Tax=Cytobacillus firmus TaxID=1399 RepID=UPI001C8EC2A9|nr:DUF485 domain-containing protein [Cytobacillus firmus]MBX9975585.1 DUF485 domain-containing protein [Cytobacillus firmus]
MENRSLQSASLPDQKLDYEKVSSSREFKNLISAKKKFLIPLSIFFLTFYFLLPLLSYYFTFLNAPLIGPISGAWVFAFAQFIMTWILCMIYVKKANRFDQMADDILKDRVNQGDKRL